MARSGPIRANTPVRECKHWVHEGGISTPFVTHWPNGIPERHKGKLNDQPAHLIDLMATSVDLAIPEYPKEAEGKKCILESSSFKASFIRS